MAWRGRGLKTCHKIGLGHFIQFAEQVLTNIKLKGEGGNVLSILSKGWYS